MGLFGSRKKQSQDNVVKIVNARGSIRDLNAMAQQLRETALQQAQAAREAMGSAGEGGQTWVRRFGSLLAGPEPGYVKRCKCTNCGAPKKLPAINAYVYCDYCGSLADYDLHRACETDTMPGPEYARLVNGLQPQLKAARAAGEKETYRDLQRQVFAAYVENVPMAVSHRAKGDDAYREQLIAYLAECGVDRAFDPEASRLEQEMAQRVAALRWTGGLTDRQVDADSFVAMTETLGRQVEVHNTLSRNTGTSELDPDRAPFIQTKLAWSMFCQGWLQYLSEEAAGQLLERTGLRSEYVQIEPEDGQTRRCSGCGGEIQALPGAKAVVCDGCGRTLDVGAAELTCSNCGGSMTMPVGASRTACPYCKVDVERVGIF